MALAQILKNCSLIVNGENYLGEVESVTLPKLTQKLETYRGGGMLAAVSVNMGLTDDALDMEFSLHGYKSEIIKLLGGGLNSVNLQFLGVTNRENDAGFKQIAALATGRLKEIDLGEFKQGDLSSGKYPLSCTYFKLLEDGKPIIEVDSLGLLFKVGDEDLTADLRKALGL